MKRRRRAPEHFDSFGELLDWREKQIKSLHAGKITRGQYRAHVRSAVRRFYRDYVPPCSISLTHTTVVT